MMAKKQENRPKRILITEDELLLAELLKDRLASMGYDVAVVENGAQALEFLSGPGADAVLMDVVMPVMDGWEATRRIKAAAQWRHIPVITLTGRARNEDKQESFNAGCDDYLAKPFRFEDLKTILAKWVPLDPKTWKGSTS